MCNCLSLVSVFVCAGKSEAHSFKLIVEVVSLVSVFSYAGKSAAHSLKLIVEVALPVMTILMCKFRKD